MFCSETFSSRHAKRNAVCAVGLVNRGVLANESEIWSRKIHDLGMPMRALVYAASASLLVAHADGFMVPTGPAMRVAPATLRPVPIAPAKLQPKWRTATLPSIKMEEATEEPSAMTDALAGLTVAFSLLSKAIACSAIVGVSPLVGLWSSVFMGILTPLIGARPGVISGLSLIHI